MPRKPQILNENEYTVKKLIEKVGGNNNTWRKYLLIEPFASKIELIEQKYNLFKFRMLVPELQFKELFIKYRDNMASKKIINAKIASRNMPIKTPKSTILKN